MRMIDCAILGFEIHSEACNASGNHSICRKCRSVVEDNPAIPLERARRSRKRCECGRIFSPKSNRQRLCEICKPQAERRRKAEWERKRRKSMSVRGRLEAKNRKEIGVF